MEEELENEVESEKERMSASDGKSEHSRKEIMKDIAHKSSMESKYQNEGEFRPRFPIQKNLIRTSREIKSPKIV